MCGIFAYIGQKTELQIKLNELALKKLEPRGPDHTTQTHLSPEVWFGFTRLVINGLDEASNQPFYLDKVWVDESDSSQISKAYAMCNGEIYNCHQLQKEHGFEYYSGSDCEVILHLYHKFGFQEAIKHLVGVFSIALYDETKNILYLANDRIGIRPLYWGFSGDEKIGYKFFFASEPSALYTAGAEHIDFFTPGTITQLNLNDKKSLTPEGGWSLANTESYYSYNWKPEISLKTHTLEQILAKIRQLLEHAIDRRMMSDRPIATLLSGGLDSSLVSALVARELRKTGHDLAKVTEETPELLKQQKLLHGRVHTFSVGLKGSPDLYYAKLVADHIGSVHHHVEFTEEEFLDAIPEVIRAIQSWDTTTVRASVGNYLIAKHIKENTDFIVIFNGDVSEEVNASYKYSRFAPSPKDFFEDNITLLREVHQYDVLRSARCVESQGLESRTPFADQDFVDFMMRLDPALKMVGESYQPIEKYLLRKAYDGTGLLPDEVLWRPKEAFSDGVSDEGRSWHTIIQEYIDSKISDKEFYEGHLKYLYHCPPPTKEAYYYRKIFEEALPGHAGMIKKYWMPRFVKGVNDPSARAIQ